MIFLAGCPLALCCRVHPPHGVMSLGPSCPVSPGRQISEKRRAAWSREVPSSTSSSAPLWTAPCHFPPRSPSVKIQGQRQISLGRKREICWVTRGENRNIHILTLYSTAVNTGTLGVYRRKVAKIYVNRACRADYVLAFRP